MLGKTKKVTPRKVRSVWGWKCKDAAKWGGGKKSCTKRTRKLSLPGSSHPGGTGGIKKEERGKKKKNGI